jgi:myo-inositol-1(or 4)-monophosphatase
VSDHATLTSAEERADFAEIALLVAEEAAALVSAGFRSRPAITKKGRHDLVTEYDRASEQLLVQRLGALAPGLPVVGEEQTSARDIEGRRGLVWYVDPIDGTTNFVHGHPFWCVAVGLMENDRPIAGAVVAPMIGVRWTGWVSPAGAGGEAPALPGAAFRNGEPCAVSEAAHLGESLVATGFPPVRDRAPENNFDSFMAVKRKAQAVRRCGSAAMDLTLVADGTYEGYWERSLHAWDMVAASAVLLGAGGTITSFDGGAPSYHAGYIVATNGRIHAELLATIQASAAAPAGG